MSRFLDTLIAGELQYFSGGGLVVVLVLFVALRLTLPRSDLGKLRVPLLLVGFHLVFAVANAVTGQNTTGHRVFQLAALLMLLLAIGRMGFLLAIDALLVRRFGRPIPKIFRDILEGLVYTAAILIVLRSAGTQLDTLLTTSALLTAVIGLSLQDTLGNLFAGLAIQAQTPFEVGDWIQYGENPETIGRVTEINWRATKVTTLDDVEVIIPNGPLARLPIHNFTKPTKVSRRSIRVVLPFTEAPHRVRRVIETALVDTWGVLERPIPSVVTEAFEERGVRYWIRYWTTDYEKRETTDGLVRERVWYALRRAGIEIAVPIADLELTQDDETARQRARAEALSRRRKALLGVDFLRVLEEEQLEQLARSTRERPYAPGEIIIREGDSGEEFFIVSRGEVAIAIGKGVDEVEVAHVDAGSFFGEMSVMTGEARAATVRAVTDTLVLVVGRAALQSILEEAPKLAEEISEVLAARQEQLDSASSKPAAPKIADSKVGDRTELLSRIKQFFSLSQ
jgi:small-conductance mechanosensitive channel/CRP-like cAMP-binding protein